MIFKIIDNVSNTVVDNIDADSGKTALEYFKLSHGMAVPYDIAYDDNVWVMTNQFGSHFTAMPTYEG